MGPFNNSIRDALAERAKVAIYPTPDSMLVRNINTFLVKVINHPESFEYLSAADSRHPGALDAIRSSAFHMQGLIEEGSALAVIYPQRVGKHGRVATRVRVVVEREDLTETHRRSAVSMLIQEWVDKVKCTSKEDQWEILQLLAEEDAGWAALAVALGHFSGFDYSELKKLVRWNKTGEFLISLYPREKRRPTLREKQEIADLFADKFPDHLLTTFLEYPMHVTYGMDLGSVMRDIVVKMRDSGASVEDTDFQDLLDRYGTLMYFRPLDVFSVELPRTSPDKNLFRGLTKEQILEHIRNFIHGHSIFLTPLTPNQAVSVPEASVA